MLRTQKENQISDSNELCLRVQYSPFHPFCQDRTTRTIHPSLQVYHRFDQLIQLFPSFQFWFSINHATCITTSVSISIVVFSEVSAEDVTIVVFGFSCVKGFGKDSVDEELSCFFKISFALRLMKTDNRSAKILLAVFDNVFLKFWTRTIILFQSDSDFTFLFFYLLEF